MTRSSPNRIRFWALLASAALASTSAACASKSADSGPAGAAERPNILLIVADDLGYSDIGAFGGEIATPHLDALAARGVMLTNFHANATCTPSRAMLLTGRDNHAVGFGANPGTARSYPELQGLEGYRSAFPADLATLPERLQALDYQTFMVGKWHLGDDPGSLPPARGFDRSFFLEYSGASHFGDARGNFSHQETARYWEGEAEVKELPSDFFSSTFYTDKAIDYITESVEEGGPFFGYLAYTAPHWPLQAPDDWLDRYDGRYDAGWEAIRRERLAAVQARGLLDAQAAVLPLPEVLGSWEALPAETQRMEARRMEIYAAMVSHLDHEIGRLLAALTEHGADANTIIVFLSDNGPEGNDVLAIRDTREWAARTLDLSFENMGRPGSYVTPGRGWGHVS
ncbi:MAG: sulfatase-like hydrolase/transferase, partial [Caulobacterales bacterium]|nr:sulfatase-like hydrolase/transferase [Caulobacterales bacterium]